MGSSMSNVQPVVNSWIVTAGAAAFCLCWLSMFVSAAASQEEELQLMESVEKLQKQLESDAETDRDSAEQKLIELGPAILPHLVTVTDKKTTDFRERLNRIRTTVEKAQVEKSVAPTFVKLVGKYTVEEALQQIKRQTGNDVVVAERFVSNEEFDLNWANVEFWQAMNELMQMAKIGIDQYASQKPGQIVLTQLPQDAQVSKLPFDSSKIFQAQVTRIDSSVNLLRPNLDFTTINLLVRWEPRLLPISVDIPMSNVSVKDEFGDDVLLDNQKEVIYGMVQPEIPEIEFSLRLPRIDRQVESLEKLSLKVEAVLPGQPELFRIKNMGKLEAGKRFEKAGANLVFGGTRKNEDVYAVRLSLSFDEENNALESHQGWVFQNEVYLQDQQGNREDALSLETLRQDNEKVTIQYYFLSDPKEKTLFYRTPTSIIKMPVKMELKRIPLP